MTSQSELKDLFVQHRKNIRKFNTSVAEAVGLLRVRREGEKVGRQPDDLPEPKLPPPFDILGYKQVLFKDMKPDIVHKGKYIILTVLDIPHQYEFESADLHLSQYVSAVVLVKDEEGVAHRAFIYNYVKPDLCREYLGNEELVRQGNIELNNLNRHLAQVSITFQCWKTQTQQRPNFISERLSPSSRSGIEDRSGRETRPGRQRTCKGLFAWTG